MQCVRVSQACNVVGKVISTLQLLVTVMYVLRTQFGLTGEQRGFELHGLRVCRLFLTNTVRSGKCYLLFCMIFLITFFFLLALL